jgi:hypothetical protein
MEVLGPTPLPVDRTIGVEKKIEQHEMMVPPVEDEINYIPWTRVARSQEMYRMVNLSSTMRCKT